MTSITENQIWLTELTDAEMESTTGGLLSSTTLDGWLNDYKNGVLKQLSMFATLQKEFKSTDAIADVGVISFWLAGLSKDDRRTVIGGVATAIGNYVKSYLKL